MSYFYLKLFKPMIAVLAAELDDVKIAKNTPPTDDSSLLVSTPVVEF
jgi:hypothetical protein